MGWLCLSRKGIRISLGELFGHADLFFLKKFFDLTSSKDTSTLQLEQGYFVERGSYPQRVEKIKSPSFKKSGNSCPDMSHICNILHMMKRV